MNRFVESGINLWVFVSDIPLTMKFEWGRLVYWLLFEKFVEQSTSTIFDQLQ